MPTRNQIIAIQRARQALKLNDAQYRTVLRNVGGVGSSKLLSNEGVEGVMAVFEAMGFDNHPGGSTYWRDRADRGGGRQVWKIVTLAAEQRYELAALCERFSGGRASKPADLTPRERWNLIEMLKAAAERERNPRQSPRPSRGRRQPVTEDPQNVLPF